MGSARNQAPRLGVNAIGRKRQEFATFTIRRSTIPSFRFRDSETGESIGNPAEVPTTVQAVPDPRCEPGR